MDVEKSSPVAVLEVFVQSYSEGGYVPTSERKRLIAAIARSEEERPR